ncbi:Hypothetical protein I595_210 [Croceitalea dokdonensis DOKDO 023]|uniref:Uncharacterized protein n=1 Tax=Croceitalea dokdonensis DOKDO 023 TaxID=1300341 RepID=A0A0P7A906_9FLAO|nr:Hypothetical protein I595_210 [Croceitalea dokdonensis DOKDO 023]
MYLENFKDISTTGFFKNRCCFKSLRKYVVAPKIFSEKFVPEQPKAHNTAGINRFTLFC